MDVEHVEDTPLIQFRQAEQRGPGMTSNDALVITALLANYEVGRIFIDLGSLVDILFSKAYDQMQLGDVPLKVINTSLCGFVGEVVHSRGMISLPLTLGETPLGMAHVLKFLVVDIPSAYNVILGRPTLNAFQAVVSTYHMIIKFLVNGGVGFMVTQGGIKADPANKGHPRNGTPTNINELIVKQVKGEYEAKEKSMIRYLQQTEELKMKFKSFKLQQIPRGDMAKQTTSLSWPAL
ncbi:UNVERIFIED_CONTAM: hypothetical protein Scaly_2810300 [Sesamum calycinum]|uniref:Uncharacterized protein n=1 Tax=Sesamum calycinum TaxID=2727403 RepID=A0AAW2IUH5_9LAMI